MNSRLGRLMLMFCTADHAHERLKRYYTRLFGFQAVREVGGGNLTDLPHLLVWGGVGTRMDGDIEAMLRKCSQHYRKRQNAEKG